MTCLLAIETATASCSVALTCDGAVLQRTAGGGDRPSEQVPLLIGELFAEAGFGLSRLDAIAFDAGPGSFTGIRVGCGLAQGIALGLDRPLVQIGSLALLAMQAPAGRVVALLDARMAEIYWAPFERADTPQALPQALAIPRVCPPGEWVCPLDIDALIGDGLAAYPALCAVLPAGVAVLDRHARPRAVDMLPLALAELAAGRGIAAEAASPLYVRDKVALTASEQLARRAQRA